MFKHLFMNKMKILLKNKAMLFWSLIFPFVFWTIMLLVIRIFRYTPVSLYTGLINELVVNLRHD